jgi:antitoxin HicB
VLEEEAEVKHSYTVILRKEPEGCYTVLVPALPGCITCGETVKESLEMAQEAIECYLESLLKHGEPIPEEGPVISFEKEDFTEGFFFEVTATVGEEAVAYA